MTTPGETAAKREGRPPAGCGGDGCDARDPWPLHHVRHFTVYCRLCTSCVLKYNPGAFCASCFEILAGPPPPPACRASGVVRCSRCPAVSHSACLADAGASPYFCPSCANPNGFSYFPAGKGSSATDHRDRFIDVKSSKVLLAAAQLAAASMNRASASARADAEKKVKEAVLARKRAKEMLERVFQEKENKRRKESAGNTTSGTLKQSQQQQQQQQRPVEAADQKKKMQKLNSTTTAPAQKRVQNWERDRWMRFQEPLGMVKMSKQGVTNDKSKLNVAALAGKQNNMAAGSAEKDKVASLPNQIGGQAGKEDKGSAPNGSQDGFSKEEKVVLGAC